MTASSKARVLSTEYSYALFDLSRIFTDLVRLVLWNTDSDRLESESCYCKSFCF